MFCVLSLHASRINGQRRALVYYHQTSTEEPEPVSENPLSSSINSIQTGREELTAFYRGDTGSGVSNRRGIHKTTTPPYFKDPFVKGDSANTGKTQSNSSSKSSENDEKSQESPITRGSRENRPGGDTVIFNHKRSTSMELPSSSTVRPETGRSSQRKDEVKQGMDINKSISARDQDRRTNTQESRRHTTTPSSSLSAKFNTSVRDSSEKHREEPSEKAHSERPNKERRPTSVAEDTRGHRTATRSTSDKGQILTHPTPRIPTVQRYDRTEQPLVSTGSQDRKVPDRHLDSRDSLRNIDDKKKVLDVESDIGDKAYTTGNDDRSKPRDDQTDSSNPNKPTQALGEEERPLEVSRNPDGYRDQFTAGQKGDMNGKVGSDIEKSSGGGDGKTYSERSYPRDDEERSPSHHTRDADRSYTRRHRDRYDDRSYDERPSKSGQSRRGQERTATYDSRDRTGGRTSRPRDRNYDEEYRDDVYSSRDTVKSSDNIPKDRVRGGSRPYPGSAEDVDDRDRYPADGTRNYRDYSGDTRYKDESDRDNRRRYKDDDNRKYADENSRRTYDDDYDDSYIYRDDYSGRYDKEGESRRHRDDATRRYTGSGSRRYDDEETRRPADYDRPVHRYKDDDEYKYNSTRRYRDSYDVYRDDNRRSSGESVGLHRYDEKDGTRFTRYDDDDYKGSRSYSTRDGDQKYIRRDYDDTLPQRDSTRKYGTDDATRYREDDEGRYREEPRTYSGGSSRDSYDQTNRRSYAGDGSTYIGTHTDQERPEIDPRRDYDDANRRSSSRRTHVDGSYSSYPYAEDEYYNNRTSTEYADRYDRSDRPTRRTDDDYSALTGTDGDDRKYAPRSSDERRRDKDRTYTELPVVRRSDADGTRRGTRRAYEEDRRSDRDRVDSYDERTYRDRDADEYIRSSRGRDYDTPIYRDSDEEIDTSSYRGREDVDINDRYRGDDTVRNRTADDEVTKLRPVTGGTRDKGYTDRTYEEGYRDKSSEGTYRYREEDDRYGYTQSDDRKPDYRDSDRRSTGTQRFRDDYDIPYDREPNIPRSTEERQGGGSKSSRREDRLTGDRTDFVDKRTDPERPSKSDTTSRSDIKTEFPDRRGDELLPKGERSSYDDERGRDRRRSHPRDIQLASTPPKTRSSDDRPDSLDKGDFGRGRRTFYNEDDKTDSDREERAKGSGEDRRLPRTDRNEDLSYTRNEKDRGSAYDTRDSRQNGRSTTTSGRSEGRTYSSRRESSDTNRHRNNDEIPASRMPLDVLPGPDDSKYPGRKEDAVNPTISQSDQGSQRRYSTASSERSGRRQLPSVREPDIDRPPRKEETEDSSLSEYRGGYRYTKSRGDRDDFHRPADDRSFMARDEYNIRGGKSSKGVDTERSDMLKGEYGSPGSGTPTRNKQDRIPEDPDHQGKEEFYTLVRDKAPPRDVKLVDDSPERRDSDRRDKVVRDRDTTARDERGMYENGEYHRSSSQEELKFLGENSTRDHSNEDARSNKENDYSTLSVVSQAAPGGRSQGSTISRSATPIPHYQDKELISWNVSSKNLSDKFSGSAVYREKRFQHDDRFNTNNASRGVAVMNDELSKRPLTTKEVIDAAYRHSEEHEKQREIFYPVYVPGSGNMTSPDVIRPSERRGITTPTKKKKKK